MKKTIIFFVICLLCLVTNGQAAVTGDLLKAVDLIYSASFKEAKTIIAKHLAAQPGDPAGYLVRGMYHEWYQLARNQGKALEKQIMDDYQTAKRLAEEALTKDVANLDKKMMLGNALMYVSKKQLDAGHKMQASLSLKQSKRMLEEVIASQPGYSEAYFAVGLFNYFAANVPPGFKWLASLMGIKGNTAKGFEYMKKAAATNNLTQKDALYMLFHVYSQREHRYPEALTYAQQLHNRYPANLIFLFDQAEMLFRTKKTNEARDGFKQYFDRCEAQKGTCRQEQLFLANYFMTRSYVLEKNYKVARPYWEEAMKLDSKKFKDRTAEMKKWERVVRD